MSHPVEITPIPKEARAQVLTLSESTLAALKDVLPKQKTGAVKMRSSVVPPGVDYPYTSKGPGSLGIRQESTTHQCATPCKLGLAFAWIITLFLLILLAYMRKRWGRAKRAWKEEFPYDDEGRGRWGKVWEAIREEPEKVGDEEMGEPPVPPKDEVGRREVEMQERYDARRQMNPRAPAYAGPSTARENPVVSTVRVDRDPVNETHSNFEVPVSQGRRGGVSESSSGPNQGQTQCPNPAKKSNEFVEGLWKKAKRAKMDSEKMANKHLRSPPQFPAPTPYQTPAPFQAPAPSQASGPVRSSTPTPAPAAPRRAETIQRKPIASPPIGIKPGTSTTSTSGSTSSSSRKAKHKAKKEAAKSSESPFKHFHNFADNNGDLIKQVHQDIVERFAKETGRSVQPVSQSYEEPPADYYDDQAVPSQQSRSAPSPSPIVEERSLPRGPSSRTEGPPRSGGGIMRGENNTGWRSKGKQQTRPGMFAKEV
ncbi:hypothetical protein B0J14DRAFT_557484 [Halenospora varia]|nr:hypothetical protein B0J14DRAFT_557484 [Halenospora varia]